MVLLKNYEEFLPIETKPDANERPLKHVALLGPFSTNISELVGSYTKHIDPNDTVPLDKGKLTDTYMTIASYILRRRILHKVETVKRVV